MPLTNFLSPTFCSERRSPITEIMRKANANSKVFGTVIVIYKCTMQSSNYYFVINVRIVI